MLKGASIIALLIVTSWLILSSSVVNKNIKIEDCELSDNKYLCYTTRAREISRADGVKASLDYVDTVVMKNSQYGLVHLVLHVVGEEAYLQSKDFKKALSYVPEHSGMDHDVHMGGYDGFAHGVFRGYFFANKKEKEPAELMRDVCGQYYNSTSQNQDESPSMANECAHGVGHALMFALDNEVSAAIKVCNELRSKEMVLGCYKGVFMENGYLYMPFYENIKPKPNASGNSMVALCNNLDDVTGNECSTYVGDSYLSVYRRDVSGAVKQCKLLSNSHRQNRCVHRIGAIYITGYYGGNFQKMVDICKESVSDFLGTCLRAVADGITLGAAGEQYKVMELCDFVEPELESKCRDGK